VVADRDEVIQDAADVAGEREAPPAPQLGEKELNRFLNQDERDELKALSGHVTGNAETLARFKAIVAQAYQHFDEPVGDLSSLKVKHQLWIKQAIAMEKGDA
jgi:hypothetical protein